MHRGFGAIAVFGLLGCGGEEPAAVRTPPHPEVPAQAEGAPAGGPEAPAAVEVPYVDVRRRLMGTEFVVRVVSDRADAEAIARRALDVVEALEGKLSEWRPDSEVSRINAAAGGAPVPVSEDTFAVLRAALDVSAASEGAFDPTWAALRGLYDFHAESPTPPDRAVVRRQLPFVRWQDVTLDAEAKTVRLARRGMALGTGGVGKGYALDRAAELLVAAGLEDFMVYGGGQVQVHGARPDRPFRVGIQHPRASAMVGSFEAHDVSVSTSGDYEHSFFDADGRRVHHIVDPGTGMPADRTIAVTIVSPSGTLADALSTAVFVLGADAGLAMLREHRFPAEAAVIDRDCVLHLTDGLRAGLRFEVELEPGDVVPGCRGKP